MTLNVIREMQVTSCVASNANGKMHVNDKWLVACKTLGLPLL